MKGYELISYPITTRQVQRGTHHLDVLPQNFLVKVLDFVIPPMLHCVGRGQTTRRFRYILNILSRVASLFLVLNLIHLIHNTTTQRGI
jgi:hypothetical protein